jgi:hypothetical protein
MRRLLLATLLFTFAIATAPTIAQKKPGTQAPVLLIVTMSACTPENGYRICGDAYNVDEEGNTVYRDGEDGVKATIDQYGSLIIDLQTTRAKIRGLVYDYSAPLDGQTAAPPGDGPNHYVSTIGGNLHTMLVGETVQVSSCPLYDDQSGQPQYRHSFARDCQSGFGSVGSPLLVTRTSSGWSIEPAPGAVARVFSIMTTGRPRVRDYGQFSLPFRMTLAARP